jgi:hypothetical protein
MDSQFDCLQASSPSQNPLKIEIREFYFLKNSKLINIKSENPINSQIKSVQIGIKICLLNFSSTLSPNITFQFK